jgi:DNA modification methylase
VTDRIETLAEGVSLHCGDCVSVLAEMEAASIDSCVCDPPYHLTELKTSAQSFASQLNGGRSAEQKRARSGFMGKSWDGGDIAFRPETWAAVFRVLKPGGHLAAFGGTRTFHRMMVAIEDAGFELRDTLMWVYGQGFPKSADVSKHLDREERNSWLNVCKAIDNTDQRSIVQGWIEYSGSVRSAALQFAKSQIAIGTNTPKSASALAPVRLQITPEKFNASAIIAELRLGEVHLTNAAYWRSALSSAYENSTALSALVSIAENSLGSREATQSMQASSAPRSAWDWLGESTTDKLKGGEALKIWLGSKASSKPEATTALYAALTDDLKLITLSRSKTFRSLDTKSQMDFVSATTVTITESTAASLLSFTAATLKSKGIDRAAGAKRVRLGTKVELGVIHGQGDANKTKHQGWQRPWHDDPDADAHFVTAPATDAARQWQGFGTALKPAWEPIALFRKPLDPGMTVAGNVLAYGTGAINVDGCRVATDPSVDDARLGGRGEWHIKREQTKHTVSLPPGSMASSPLGRWPANLVHDGSEEVIKGFPDAKAGGNIESSAPSDKTGTIFGAFTGRFDNTSYGDSGSAARFFYTAKADADDRLGSKHPTVKPLDLMQWLVRLVTPPKGTVLDCFAGTGTTGEAAFREGFKAVLIEKEAEYQNDIRRRMSLALSSKSERSREGLKASGKAKTHDDLPLFESFDKRSGPKPPKQEAFL